mmetsp:Transcript_21285/g.47570  ORF Transcript_21285/g.47570 Transcript_21285/m.47570 type:complete len:259 (-) Transcript_21285:459-1235(-)
MHCRAEEKAAWPSSSCTSNLPAMMVPLGCCRSLFSSKPVLYGSKITLRLKKQCCPSTPINCCCPMISLLRLSPTLCLLDASGGGRSAGGAGGNLSDWYSYCASGLVLFMLIWRLKETSGISSLGGSGRASFFSFSDPENTLVSPDSAFHITPAASSLEKVLLPRLSSQSSLEDELLGVEGVGFGGVLLSGFVFSSFCSCCSCSCCCCSLCCCSCSFSCFSFSCCSFSCSCFLIRCDSCSLAWSLRSARMRALVSSSKS